MNIMEASTIEEEIALVHKKIEFQRRMMSSFDALYKYASLQSTSSVGLEAVNRMAEKESSTQRAKIDRLEQKPLTNLKLLLSEEEAGWKLVFIPE